MENRERGCPALVINVYGATPAFAGDICWLDEDAMAQDALRQLGMGSVLLKSAQKEEDRRLRAESTACNTGPGPDSAIDDHFIEKEGVRCAGLHLIIDLFEAEKLDDIDHIERALVDCVEAAGATLLHIHLHPFEPNGGVSGVAVLAESHISIHSWPERGYAALDAFMCGNAHPERCIEVLRDAFNPGRVKVREMLRGKNA